jgi:cytochrome c peroxidase
MSPTKTPHTRFETASRKAALALLLPALVLATATTGCSHDSGNDRTPVASDPPTVEDLGALLFADTNLSTPAGRSCQSCHNPSAGFADPDHGLPTSKGAVKGRFGDRNSPTAAYASASPDFAFDSGLGEYVGGQFWDGRAKDLVEQAQGPFLNPVEMNNADAAEVVNKVKDADYAAIYEELYGSLDSTDTAFLHVAEAIAAFEASSAVTPYTSKYDAYLAGTASLTSSEAHGLELFTDSAGPNCVQCHSLDTGKDGTAAVFTNHQYRNIGVPKNPDNPFYSMPAEFNPDGADFVDLGLGSVLKDPTQYGKMKVPTLRNIVDTSPYMHNGVYGTLEEVLNLYWWTGASGGWGCGCGGGCGGGGTDDTASGGCGGGGCGGGGSGGGMGGGGMGDTASGGCGGGGCGGGMGDTASGGCGSGMGGGGCGGGMGGGMGWSVTPEVAENIATDEIAKVTVTPDDYDDIIAFLGTLSDGYTP